VSVSAGRLFAVLFIHLWQFATNENAGNVEKIRNASASISAVGTLYSPVAICNKRKCRNCKQNRNAGVSISAGRLLAVLFIHLWQFATNKNAGIVKKIEIQVLVSALADCLRYSLFTCGNLQQMKMQEM